MDDHVADTVMDDDVSAVIDKALTDADTFLHRSGHQIFWEKETTPSGRVQFSVWQDDNGDS